MSDSAFVKKDFHRILCDDADVFSWILSKASIGVFYINLEHQDRFHITASFWNTMGYKNPKKEEFVSYHQDTKYIGLEPHNWVTAWIAITDSNNENGCMRMWPKSHIELKDHNQKFNKGNLLTRGQTVEGVPENEIKSIELKAGQMSLHHPRIVHGSGINKSNDRRIGFVVQSYIGTNVKQTLGKNSVQIARGKDELHHHEVIGRTNSFMSEAGKSLRMRENKYLQEIFYKGSDRKGTY